MTSWASNYLTVQGEKSEVERFVNHVRAEENGKLITSLDLNKLYPMSPQLDCFDHWGTKWNVCCETEWNVVDDNEGNATATLFYDTAWLPAIGAIREGSKLFPSLTFCNQSCDPVMDWACETTCENGEMDNKYSGTFPKGLNCLDNMGSPS